MEKPRITVQVTEKQRKRWKEFAEDEDPEASSMSHLVRLSVEKRIQDVRSDDSFDTTQIRNIVGGAKEDILHEIGEIHEYFDELEHDIKMLGIDEIQPAVHALLPLVSDAEDIIQLYDRYPDDYEKARYTGSATAIARVLNVDQDTVKESMELLDANKYKVKPVDEALERMKTSEPSNNLDRARAHVEDDSRTRYVRIP